MIDTKISSMTCDKCGEVIEGYYHTIDDNENQHYCLQCAVEITNAKLSENLDISIDTWNVDDAIASARNL